MSIMRFSEAVESVLRREMEARPEIVLLRPGARRTLDAPEQEIPLPRLGSACFDIALGVALAGMRPVLDLRKEDAAWLGDALRSLPLAHPPIAILVSFADADAVADRASLLRPRGPRQAAGFLRSALTGSRTAVLIDDPALAPITGDVPEEEDFLLLPAGESEEDWFPEEDAAKAEDAETNDDETGEDLIDEAFPPEEAEEETEEIEETEDAEDAPEEWPEDDADEDVEPEMEEYAENTEAIIEDGAWKALSARGLPCDFARVDDMNDELDAPQGLLISLCMERLAQGRAPFSWQRDEDALPGECAFLPPRGDESAHLWLGRDRLCLSYDGERLPHEGAALLLRAARRLLENPALLIYDKERDLT